MKKKHLSGRNRYFRKQLELFQYEPKETFDFSYK